MRTLRLLLIVTIIALSANAQLARAAACPHAPRTRLQVGMAAVVAPGIGVLNLRALPAVDTGIETQISAGMAMTVLSGPSCNGNINWWRVELESGLRGWVAEGTWEQYFVIPTRDAENPRNPVDYSCPPITLTRCLEL
ncbi:MAG: SH3 domain-containing protein [Chloroflexota bacterium]|nr:SH3 domain-containing protein [Chloroflexota bacterium]